MKRCFLVLPVMFALVGACSAPGILAQSGKRIVGYYTSWSIYARNYNVAAIKAEMLTQINYAFAKIDANGLITMADPWSDYQKVFSNEPAGAKYHGCFMQLTVLKEKYPALKTLISVGGWTLSSGFSNMAATAEGRSKFAASCVDFIRTYNFDGVDLDWEYPVRGGFPPKDQSPDDGANFVLLLQEMRKQFDAAGTQDKKSYLLTAATSANPVNIADLDLPGLSKYLDWINVMAFDYHVGSEKTANHASPLYGNPADPDPKNAPFNVDNTIKVYHNGGVPSDKLVLGIPFYGRGWDGVPAAGHGLFQPSDKPTTVGTWEPAVFDYDDLAAKYMAADGSNVYWDPAAHANYIYIEADKRFITYESVKSCQEKMDYIKRNNLGGAMFWELSCDRKQTLLGAIYNGLK